PPRPVPRCTREPAVTAPRPAHRGSRGRARRAAPPRTTRRGRACAPCYARPSPRFTRGNVMPGRSGAPEVVTGARVHLDLLAGRGDRRHWVVAPRRRGGGLGPAGGPVALDTGVGLLDGQLHRGGQFHVQRVPVVERHHRGLVLQQVVRGAADRVRGDPWLVV